MIAEKLPAARVDVRAKTKAQIDLETACVWGARAVAALEHFHASKDFHWYAWAIEYRHEAIEHAAGGPPGTLETITAELAQFGL